MTENRHLPLSSLSLSNGNGALGPNTLDAFGHGGAYGVSNGANPNSNGAPANARCLDIFTVDSVAAANFNRRNFAASPMPPQSVGSHQRGARDEESADAAYAPPSYHAATANSRKQDGFGGRIAANGLAPKVGMAAWGWGSRSWLEPGLSSFRQTDTLLPRGAGGHF